MHDSGTVLDRHVVGHDHAKSVALQFVQSRPDPRDQLFVPNAVQFRAGIFAHDGIVFDFGPGHRLFEQVFGQDDGLFFPRIGIGADHLHIAEIRPYGQRHVARQCPRRGRPREEIEIAPDRRFAAREQEFAFGVADHFELRRAGGVLHIAVAPRLVQLVVREARPGRRRIGLDGVAFIEQPFVVELREHPPQGFDIFVVVGDVRVFHIDPVPHPAGQFVPQPGIFHHRFAAGAVILFDGDFFADIFFGDAQFLFHAQLDRQAVGVPPGLAVHEKPFLGLVTAEYVFDGTGHYVVDARDPVGRRRPFVKHERGVPFAGFDAFMESILLIPLSQHFGAGGRQVESFILCEFLAHGSFRFCDWQRYDLFHSGQSNRC